MTCHTLSPRLSATSRGRAATSGKASSVGLQVSAVSPAESEGRHDVSISTAVLFAWAWLFRSHEFVNASKCQALFPDRPPTDWVCPTAGLWFVENHANNYHVIMHALSLIRVASRLPLSQIFSAAHSCWHQQVGFSAIECTFFSVILI